MREVYEINISPGCYYIHIADKPGLSEPTERWNRQYGRGDEAQIEAMSCVPLMFEEGFSVSKANPTIFMPVLHNDKVGDKIKYRKVGTLFNDTIFSALKSHLEKYGSESNYPCNISSMGYDVISLNEIIIFDANPETEFKPFVPTATGKSELELQRERLHEKWEKEQKEKMLREIYDLKSKTNVLSRGLSSVKSILSAMPDSQGKSKLLQWLENNNKNINRAIFERLTDNGVLTIIVNVLNGTNLS